MSQFLEVIEWIDATGQEIIHRFPPEGSAEIKFSAQLIVREPQAAIFFRDGKGLDVFGLEQNARRNSALCRMSNSLSPALS
jgi:membrane protease subunit (stomatin/prohibitin family)